MRDPLAADVDQDPEQLASNIAEEFLRPQASSRVLLCGAALALGALGCLALARFGSDLARISGAIGLVGSLVLVFGFMRWARRRRGDVSLGLQQALSRLPPDFAGQVERAYRLFRNSQSSPNDAASSPVLARLHATRLLKRVDLEHISSLAQRARTIKMRCALALGTALSITLFTWSLELIEGLDVLLARGGVGAFPIAYVEDIEITAEWPSYLDGTGQRRRIQSELTGVPQGTEVEVRVMPLVKGRQFLLTDGNEQVPLVSDGQGGLVARWLADDPAGLKVAARFGEVLLYDHHQTRVQPLDDRAPSVVLADAPRTIALNDLDRLELSFIATDDHGLHQVDLVLQSGQRSTRTELARLDGQARVFRGGHALSREQELLRKPFLPVHIWVEARDGNTATGPSWGRSKELLILPDPLGKAVGQRHVALRSFRRSLSAYVAQMHRAGYQDPRTRGDEEKVAIDELVAALLALKVKWEAEPNAPLRSLAFLSAQVETLNRDGKKRALPEDVLLAVDALIHNLGRVDATQLAKDMAQSVEEIAVQSRQLRFDPASLSVDGLLDLLSSNQAAASQLSEVGVLGLDLGSVALADLTRISRNIKDRAFDRAEASALHLAERLKRATPSFSSTAGGAGVESGAPSQGQNSGESTEGQPTSEAPSEFERLAEQIDQLAQDGAEELSELERLLKEAEDAVRKDFQGSGELDAALDELTQALSDLPAVGRGSDNASNDAASARSQGEAALEALEGGELKEGIERARDAERSLQRAKSRLLDGFGFVSEATLNRAEKALKTAMDEAKRALERAQSDPKKMNEAGKAERTERQRAMSERALDLAARGTQPHSALPKANIDDLKEAARLLKQAAQALDDGQAKRGVEFAEQAQKHMERAAFERKEQESRDAKAGSGEGSEMDRTGQIPDGDQDRAKDFRERVEQGLGRGSGRLSPAVRRYAEDLK